VKVLVTGGAGFIGSHVVDALLTEGCEVRVLDSLDASVHGSAPPVLDPRAELLMGNISDVGAVEAAISGVDAVCHQAAKVGLGVDFGDVDGYVTDNDLGTARLLTALWRRRWRGRLVLASSMVVYGEGRARCDTHGLVRAGPRSEADLEAGAFEPRCTSCGGMLAWVPLSETEPPDPRNVYAATKLHQEHLCEVWGRETANTVVALRYHNVYGPRMPRDTPYAGVAAIFRSAVTSGRRPQVFEDGGQTRDFVHVRDVARANVLALTACGVRGGVYNVASGEPHTVLDLARALSGGGEVDVTGRWRGGDVRHVVASPALAAERLGFEARVSFAEGMAEFVEAPLRPVPART
jgi:dTDP-L-rhamnose 4-epimerase